MRCWSNAMHWQHDWMRALQRDTGASASSLRDARDLARFEIYRASFEANLSGALRDTYPVVHRLVGEAYFNQTALRYLRKHPSASADIHAFGAFFPSFLNNLDSARDLPYLFDVARLEWLAHLAFHTQDAEAFKLAGLAALPPEAHAGLRLLPCVKLMCSEFPVHRIWQVNQESWTGDAAVNLDEGGVQLAVTRDGLEIALLPLGAATWALAGALLETGSLGTAIETMGDADTLGQALHELIGAGLIAVADTRHERHAS
jgi:hypothetical protein